MPKTKPTAAPATDEHTYREFDLPSEIAVDKARADGVDESELEQVRVDHAKADAAAITKRGGR